MAFKKKTILYNMYPRFRHREVFCLRVPVDDWDLHKHEAITRRLQRAKEDGQGWTAFDNGLDRGYFIYVTDIPGMKGFEPIDDIK